MQTALRAETILVVDDAESVRKLVCAMLSANGYRCVEACDGHQALEIVQNSPDSFHLVVTDMIMPRMSGAEFAVELNRVQPDVPIVFMSGYMEDPLVQQFETSARFLPKPFTSAALLAAVRQSLGG